ncbi:MAG: VIT1/CCC1 transporter family protein [Candidatus Uhrbacteria bacterium]
MDEKKWRHEVAESMREIVFGLEDSFVSTLGAVTGIAAGAGNTYIVILSGLVIVSVEALSMAAGSYLSNKSASEAEVEILFEEGKPAVNAIKSHPVRSGLIMGIFYLVGGCVPLAPYFFLPIDLAYGPSILLTGICLFALGAWSSSFAKKSAWKGGWQMVAISLGAAMLGFIVGRAVSVLGVNVKV